MIHAQCWTTGTTPKPDSQYVVQSSAGTVVDTATNLMWKQCGEGVSGADCLIGSWVATNWDDSYVAAYSSRFAGYNDWRLLTLTELQSLLPSDCGTQGPTINRTVFPSTLANLSWSGTIYSGSSSLVWVVGFSGGSSSLYSRNYGGYVRLVRAGRPFGILAPISQTLTFGTPAPPLLGGTAVVAATSATPNSGNGVVYASTTPTVCSVNASTGAVNVTNTAVAGDTCIISANQFGREYIGQYYMPATQVTQSLAVKGVQSVAFAPAVNVGTSGVVAATSNQGITPVSFSTTTASICNLSGANNSTVTGVSVGICTVTASAPSDANYLAGTATLSFNIGIGTQTLAFGAAPSITAGGTGSVAATSDKGLTPITLTSTTPPVCTSSNGIVSGVSAGTCSIVATQNGSSAYSPASAMLAFPINAAAQTISFAAAPTINVGGTGPVTATSNQALATVTLSTGTPLVCTVGGGTVSAVSAGMCTINAAAPSSATYLAATASQSFGVGIGAQALAFAAAPSITAGGTGSLAATSDQGLTPITLTSTTLPVCTIGGGMVRGVSAGTCTINAAAPSGANYLAATASQSFGIGIGAPTLTFGTAPLVTVGGTDSVTVTSDKTATPVSLTSSTPTCTVVGGVVAGVSVDVCTLQATQPAASSFSTGSASLSFNPDFPLARFSNDRH